MKAEKKEHRILKVETCPSLSGLSTLTYHVGCNEKSEVFVRVWGNTGGGYFNPHWVSLKEILATLKKAKKPLTSWSLHPLFEGKSVNSPAFLLAALKHEGLVEREGRCYELADSKEFLERMQALVESDIDLKVEETPKSAKK